MLLKWSNQFMLLIACLWAIILFVDANSGTPIYVTNCASTQAQSWTVSGTSINSFDKQCLDVPACDSTGGDAEVQIYPCGSAVCSGKNQMWNIQANGSIVSQLNGMCLDLNVENGKIQLWPCSGATNQQWVHTGNSFQNKVTGLCLSVAIGDPYTNPILNRDYPDPTVMKGGDGMYYAYSTQSAGCHICVSQSKNLVNWVSTSDALPSGNPWASGSYWAPDVSFHNGTYYMFYAAQQTQGGNMCIGIALSNNPMGPFKDKGTPFFCGNSFTTIDPKMFDAADGRIFLYWGSDFGPIWVRQLDSSRMNWAAGSQPAAMLTPSSAPYENLIEGAWISFNPRQSKYYFLFYSGDNCCGSNAHYAVMVARSQSPTGPFEKMGYPLIVLGGQFLATGHNSVLRDMAGEDWMFYHAYQGSDRTQRKLLMDRIMYLYDWPTIGGVVGSSGTPSNSGIGPVYA